MQAAAALAASPGTFSSHRTQRGLRPSLTLWTWSPSTRATRAWALSCVAARIRSLTLFMLLSSPGLPRLSYLHPEPYLEVTWSHDDPRKDRPDPLPPPGGE